MRYILDLYTIFDFTGTYPKSCGCFIRCYAARPLPRKIRGRECLEQEDYPKMPSVKWNVLLRHPLTSVKILLLGSWRSVLVLLARIVLPFRVRKLTLRNALARAWIRTAHEANSEVFCSEPRAHGCQAVVFAGSSDNKSVVGGWVVPTTPPQELKDKDAVVVFANGGGYAIGHGLQNLTAFRRWTKKAAAMGQDIAFVTVKYRELFFFCFLSLSWDHTDRPKRCRE